MPPSMTHPPRPRPTLGVIRLAWAALLLAAPERVIAAFDGPVDTTSVTVARILGARHAAQGLVEVATWPRCRRAGSLVDAAHSVTAAGFGAMAARWRRVGFADSVVAAGFAFAGRRHFGSPPGALEPN